MTTRKVRLGVKTFLSFLTFVVCMCICSVPASAVLTMVDATAISVNISEVVVITINSNVGEEIPWGVYLDPTSDFDDGDAELQNAVVLAAAGNQATVTPDDITGFGYAGHDYTSLRAGGQDPPAGDWSTVEFVGLAAGTYTVKLYDSAGTGGTVLDTKTITVIPEPAMIGLLGVGGMFLLGRRRRT